MEILTIPYRKDNYCYFILNTKTREVAAIDTGTFQRIDDEITRNRFTLKMIFSTHKHHDHVEGNSEFKSKYPNVEIYGSDIDKIPNLTTPLSDGDIIHFGNLEIKAIALPCHTKGHLGYLLSYSNKRALFSGDTLFLAGCGRFFEGTGDDMEKCLRKLSALPDETLVYCGHEYAAQNLLFAKKVDPENPAVVRKLNWALERRRKSLPTVPSTIMEEKAYNPFLRVHTDQISKLAKGSGKSVMNRLRQMKNNSQNC